MFKKIGYFLQAQYKKADNFLSTHPVARYSAVFGFFFLIVCLVYFNVTTLSSGDDHYFHFRFAQQMVANGFFSSFQHFQALPFSYITNGGYFVYYNFLFYLVLLPFTLITPLYLGIKLYAVFSIAAAFTIVYGCLRQCAMRWPFFWTVAFGAIIGADALWRLFTSRPFTLAPALLLLFVLSLYKKQYWWAALLTVIYFFWHSLTFYFPLLIAVTYFVAEHLYTKKNRYAVLVWVLGGTIVGLAVASFINNGFFHYLNDVLLSNFRETIIGKKVSLPEGVELYPYSFFDFVTNNIFLFSVFAISTVVQVATFFKERMLQTVVTNRNKILQLTFFFLSIGFFAGTVLVSLRFSDFFIFFCWLFIALTVTEIGTVVQISSKLVRNALIVGVILTIAYLFMNNMLRVESSIASGGSAPEEFQKVSAWITENTPSGAVIFTPTWNWFTQLYYYNPDRAYISGLEPRFLYAYDKSLYWKWYHISSDGYVCDTEQCSTLNTESTAASRADSPERRKWYATEGDAVVASIIKDFNSHYIVTSQGTSAFNTILENNKHFKRVYGNEMKRYSVYEVRE